MSMVRKNTTHTWYIHTYRYIINNKKKTSAVRSRISSKLIFASCVGYFAGDTSIRGYFDRAYYGFYVTSSRMLVLIEGDSI